jgi:hypothetical protein
LKANKVNLFVSSVLYVFWYHSPNVLDTLHICNISWLRVNGCCVATEVLQFFLVICNKSTPRTVSVKFVRKQNMF